MPRLTLPCTHALCCLLSLLELLLNTTHGSKIWSASFPQPVWGTSSSFWTAFNVVWLLALSVSQSPYLPVCSSLPVCPLCLADLYSAPTILPSLQWHTQAHTHTHTGNTNMGLFHSLSCTSSSGSTASTCINAAQPMQVTPWPRVLYRLVSGQWFACLIRSQGIGLWVH